MYTIRVHYDNGDSVTARINATVSEIVRYYLDKPMYGHDLSARARCVEFLNGPSRPRGENLAILRRVYSLSDRFMLRYNLFSRFRYTEQVYDRFSPAPLFHNDAACIPGVYES